ncbi:QRFP-like peptide receptor [Oculina patagonica]
MLGNVNTTTNGTQLLNCYNPTAEKNGTTVVYCLIFVVSLAGNIFIGIIVYKTKTMRKPINFLIVNMAMSDLLWPIFLFPQKFTELYGDSWMISSPLGQALCKLVPFSVTFSLAVSIQSLVLIALDRFGAVVFPLRSPFISSKLCPFFILATWIVAMAASSPYLFVFKLAEYPEGVMYAPQGNDHEVFQASSYVEYFLTILVVLFSTPLILIAVLYTVVYVKLKSHRIPGEQSINAGEQRKKRERNVLKMAIAIVLGFAVCFVPYSIWWILTLFVSDIGSDCGFHYFGLVARFMSYANCTINPCICFIFSKNYRQALKNLLKCF